MKWSISTRIWTGSLYSDYYIPRRVTTCRLEALYRNRAYRFLGAFGCYQMDRVTFLKSWPIFHLMWSCSFINSCILHLVSIIGMYYLFPPAGSPPLDTLTFIISMPIVFSSMPHSRVTECGVFIACLTDSMAVYPLWFHDTPALNSLTLIFMHASIDRSLCLYCHSLNL